MLPKRTHTRPAVVLLAVMAVVVALGGTIGVGWADSSRQPRTAAMPEGAGGVAAWTTFTSPPGRFSVALPSTPTQVSSTEPSPVGAIHVNTYRSAVEPNTEYVIEYNDIPMLAVFFGGARRIYREARDAYLKHASAKLLSDCDLTIQGHRGKEFVFEIPARGNDPSIIGRVRMVLVGHRLYALAATRPASAGEAPQSTEMFFSSFQLKH